MRTVPVVAGNGIVAKKKSRFAFTTTKSACCAAADQAGQAGAPQAAYQAGSCSAGLRYDFNKQYALTADYARTEGRSKLNDLTYPGRDYAQDLLSVGLRAAF